MIRILFVFTFLLYLGSATNGEFLCNNCGGVISEYKDIIEKQADDSDEKRKMSFVPHNYTIEYDVFPELVNEYDFLVTI